MEQDNKSILPLGANPHVPTETQLQLGPFFLEEKPMNGASTTDNRAIHPFVPVPNNLKCNSISAVPQGC
jgi:hypothetical protein